MGDVWFRPWCLELPSVSDTRSCQIALDGCPSDFQMCQCVNWSLLHSFCISNDFVLSDSIKESDKTIEYHGCSYSVVSISWVWAPSSNSDHQYYYIRGFLQTFICHWHPGMGPHPNPCLCFKQNLETSRSSSVEMAPFPIPWLWENECRRWSTDWLEVLHWWFSLIPIEWRCIKAWVEQGEGDAPLDAPHKTNMTMENPHFQ